MHHRTHENRVCQIRKCQFGPWYQMFCRNGRQRGGDEQSSIGRISREQSLFEGILFVAPSGGFVLHYFIAVRYYYGCRIDLFSARAGASGEKLRSRL